MTLLCSCTTKMSWTEVEERLCAPRQLGWVLPFQVVSLGWPGPRDPVLTASTRTTRTWHPPRLFLLQTPNMPPHLAGHRLNYQYR